MPIVKITGQGLAAIGLSVALLWACVIGEQFRRRDAYRERDRVMHEVYLLRHRPGTAVPVSLPAAPFRAVRPHVTAG
jgi:hypothetical protein